MLAQISDKKRLLSFLKADPFLHLYAIGDLDDFFWDRTTWYAWEEKRTIRSLFLLYRGNASFPTLLALEEKNSREAGLLLRELCQQLPERFYGHFSLHLESELRRNYEVGSNVLHLKMGLERDHFTPVLASRNRRILPLQTADLKRVLALYEEAYPGNWFDPRMLETGQYLGFEDGDRLIAVAGIHVFSPGLRVAALGNITTHPEFRGKGLGTILTSALCRQLFETVDWIGLNVAMHNTAAIRCYSRIGFVEHSRFIEALVSGRA